MPPLNLLTFGYFSPQEVCSIVVILPEVVQADFDIFGDISCRKISGGRPKPLPLLLTTTESHSRPSPAEARSANKQTTTATRAARRSWWWSPTSSRTEAPTPTTSPRGQSASPGPNISPGREPARGKPHREAFEQLGVGKKCCAGLPCPAWPLLDTRASLTEHFEELR